MTEVMHNLLGKYFSGHASVAEQQEVMEWKDASASNAADFDLLQKMWEGLDASPVIAFNTDAAWEVVENRIRKPHVEKAKVISFPRMLIGVAALLLLVSGIWWITLLNGNDMQLLVATKDGQEFRLEDGTVVYLRQGTSLRYPGAFGKDNRTVSLQGEAFFEVAENPQKPFVIHAEEADVQVLGTSFSVNTLEEGVNLIVKTGKVQFSDAGNAGRSIVVMAGEKARLTKQELNKEANADVNFNAWQSKHMVFNDTPLENVAASIAAYYRITLEINKEDAAQIAGKTVTIEFRDQSLESVLQELEMITSYTVRKMNEDRYEIRMK